MIYIRKVVRFVSIEGTLFIRPKSSEIPGKELNGREFFQSKIFDFWVDLASLS